MDLLNSLYTEHLDEISSLYERWLAMKAAGWNPRHFIEMEEWHEAHIDALVEDDLALLVCKQRAVEGNFGEYYGACRFFLRRSQDKVLDRLIASLDGTDHKKRQEISDAICHEPRPETDRWLAFTRCYFNDFNICDATVTNTNFTDTRFVGFIQASGAKFRNAKFTGAKGNLEEAILKNTIYEKTGLFLAPLHCRH